MHVIYGIRKGSIKYHLPPDYRTYLRILSPVTPEPALDAGHGAPGAGARDLSELRERERDVDIAILVSEP